MLTAVHSTYGVSSVCVTFIRQTAEYDVSKRTSWGCGTSPTIWFLMAEPTKAIQTQTTSSSVSSSTISKGLSTDAIIAISVAVPIACVTILVAAALYILRWRRSGSSPAGENPSITSIRPGGTAAEGNSHSGPVFPELMSSQIHEAGRGRAQVLPELDGRQN